MRPCSAWQSFLIISPRQAGVAVSKHTGVLYIVATPIGNLEDISLRARRILSEVDIVAAEDTRHSKKLLSALGIKAPLRAYHDFNESDRAPALIASLVQGKRVALIADAGTPLISDPGYRLVSMAHARGIAVVPVPGPTALVCALSVAGLPCDRFVFEGFAPAKQTLRLKHFTALQAETRTIIFYETPQRIVHFLADAMTVFGAARSAAIARELTKRFETIKKASLAELLVFVQADQQRQKGEFVALIHGAQPGPVADDDEAKRVLRILLSCLGVREAAAIAARLTGQRKNALYQLALAMQNKK